MARVSQMLCLQSRAIFIKQSRIIRKHTFTGEYIKTQNTGDSTRQYYPRVGKLCRWMRRTVRNLLWSLQLHWRCLSLEVEWIIFVMFSVNIYGNANSRFPGRLLVFPNQCAE
ncbi:Hypothetical_protein [Hexamita inflata]|uniref:Hypothetical_protein n=1 Tax=Hexamita inflata TaxID=28002 RepID=A0ABP1IKF0_9EUKA